MRQDVVWFLAVSSSAHAALLHNWARADSPSWMPTETGVASITTSSGWNPKITQAPGFVSEQDRVVELLRRQTDTTPWVNDKTCGWVAQEGSRAITCNSDFTCATNSDNIVGCVSGTFSPFYRVCLDYSAAQNGLCDNFGPNTGCCDNKESPACATWVWTGKPAKSQYGCAARPTIKSVLDVPQAILDSLTRITSSSTKSSSVPSTKTSDPISTNPTETQTVSVGNPGEGLTPGNQTSTTNNNTNIGAIVGGVVGGLAVLVLLVLLLCCCMRRRRNKKTSKVNKSDTRNKTTINNTAYYHSNTENNDISHTNAFHENTLPAQDVPKDGTNNGILAVFCCGGGSRKPKERREKKPKEPKHRSAPKQSTDSSVHHPQHSHQPSTTREEHHHHHHYHYDPSLAGTTTIRGDDANSGSLGRSMSFGAQSYYNSRSPPQVHQAHAVPMTFAHNSLGINVPIVPNAQMVAMQDQQHQQHPALRQSQDQQHREEKEQHGQVSVQQVQHQCQIHDRQYQTASFYGDNSSSEKVGGGGGLGGALRLNIPRNMDHSPDGASPIRLSAHIPKPSSSAGNAVSAGGRSGMGQQHCFCCTAGH